MTEKAAVDKLTNGAVGIILLLQPLLLLSVRNGMSVCFVLLVVVSFCYLTQRVIRTFNGLSYGGYVDESGVP
jgi:hypothetical protein